MANNRMWLKCRSCGEEKLLAKTYGVAWFPCGTEGGWTDWYDEHVACGETSFALEYETVEEPA